MSDQQKATSVHQERAPLEVPVQVVPQTTFIVQVLPRQDHRQPIAPDAERRGVQLLSRNPAAVQERQQLVAIPCRLQDEDVALAGYAGDDARGSRRVLSHDRSVP